MPRFTNREQLKQATNSEIEQFFSETVFEGIYSSKVRSKNKDYYKGSIKNIRIDGRQTELIGQYLDVPHNSIDIPEGPCTFKCQMNLKALREQDHYIVNLLGSTLTSIQILTQSSVPVSVSESKEQDLFDMWGVENCQCIGYYHYDAKNDVYIVDDLRKPNFDHIPYYPGDKERRPIRILYPNEISGIELNDYYLFTWKLSHRNKHNPYEIYLDSNTQPKAINPKWFIDTLFADRHNDKSKNFGSATNFLDTLSKQLSAKESTFVYELLQNANDYPVEGYRVDVEFHITDNYLLFLHSGEKFNVRNISGICGINEKEKIANKKTIGYKGIGFKTVFLNNHYVYLRTGDYSFRFDEGEAPEKKVGGKIKRLGAPFQILPIWTKHNEVAREVNDIFDKSDDKFRVQIALRPDNKDLLHVGRNCYENLFREVFSDSNIILFIPNINSVSVFINGKKERVCFRNTDEWIVGDYEHEIDQELQLLINRTIEKGNSRIPEKYKDFDYTKVSFACNHEGAMIRPIKDATLYCYLPTRASWGLPFLMNSDMIPKGDRNDIETEVKLIDGKETNFNEELASIAGSKLFLWVRDLLTSKKYHLGSVFSLIPDFKKCKREHKDYVSFLEKFENAFNTCLETGTIVPVPNDIAPVNMVILDSTGLSTSGIMSDEEFRKFTAMEDYYLPLPILRKDMHFNSFLKRYADENLIFDRDGLKNLLSNDDFKEWLQDQDNNNKFLNFLLKNDYLEDFFNETIFIEEECGNLFSAKDLYYNIDEELKDLAAFSAHLCFLSFKTRDFFKDNEKWYKVIDGQFAEFDSTEFIHDTLLSDNWEETVKALKEWETSFHFYKYLAKNDIVPDDLCNLPFFNNDTIASVEDNFNGKFVFSPSLEGEKTCNASWLSSLSFCFVSPNYEKSTLDYFKKNAGVIDYSDDFIIKNIILSEEYHDGINESQQENKDISVAFLKFCFEHESSFGNGSLRNYALNSFDCDGNEAFVLHEDHIFFPSAYFDEYSQKDWLDCDWMYGLDSDYLKVEKDEKKIKAFLEKAFYIEELDENIFYKDIVRPNISSIISNTSGSNDGNGTKNVNFVAYLDTNYNLVFEKEKDADKFSSFVFLGDSDDDSYYDIASDSPYIYTHDSELKDILDSEWFPADIVNMCTSDYGESKAIQAIKAKKYSFATFFNDVITKELDNINETINSKEASIAFHTFIIERLAVLTDQQKEVMKGAKVYLYGNGDATNRSDGHHILSKSARELASMGLVEFSDLDIIDPDYHVEENEEYWKTRLGNDQFSVTDFITWLTDNAVTFYSTIKDKDNNIEFWRWVKKCNLADQTLSSLPILPIYLTTDEYIDSNNTIYLSDHYIKEGGVETLVTQYHTDALFVSRDYVTEADDIDTWKDFWVKMGVRFEMVDILIDTIDNRLSHTEDTKLPATIAKHRLKLDEHYEGNLISNLRALRVKAHDGEFYSLSEVIYIDCEKDEPFKYIGIPNQVSFPTADERKLIIDILDEIDIDRITKLTEWQKVKINQYIAIQDDEDKDDLLRSIHFRFVDELVAMYHTDKDCLKEFDQISNVLFLDSDNEFTDVTELTEGSLYHPFCDFEKFGLDYNYISNAYLKECTHDIRKMLNRVFKIHCDFKKEDIKYLSNRDFAIYFWSHYLIKRDADISGVKKLIEDQEFDSIACIPTKDSMKKPEELYSLEISSYVIKHVNDWENKLPLRDLPNIEYDKKEKHTLFGLLLNNPSNLRLSFCDSLCALFSIAGKDRRAQILQWMIETYNEKYDINVIEYRDDKSAKWKNTKNDDKPISELYALAYNDKKLEQYFGNLPQIINKEYLPAGPLSFKSACDILRITTIEHKDLIVDKVGQVSKNDVYKKTLRIYALVLAGYEDAENWVSRYKKYGELIDALKLWCCSAISIRYEKDENICQNLKKFFREKGSADFYFVKSLDDKRVFKPFVENFIEYLGIEADKDFVETVMDSRESAIEIAQDNNTLMLDAAFKDELDVLMPGIKIELNGREAFDSDFVAEDKRHIFIDDTYEAEIDNPKNTVPIKSYATESSEIKEDQKKEIVYLREDEYDDDDKREAIEKSNEDLNEDDFCKITEIIYTYNDKEIATVCEHYRSGTWVRGHYRDGSWVNGYWRNGSNVSTHVRERRMPDANSDKSNDHSNESQPSTESISRKTGSASQVSQFHDGTTSDSRQVSKSQRYSDSHRNYEPREWTKDDIERIKSKGVARCLSEGDADAIEIDQLNTLLGANMSAEEIADTNYLVQKRLYQNLIDNHYEPEESLEKFVKANKSEHKLLSGKYIHKCSAKYGIVYISPSIWNKVASGKCIVCVYLGKRAKDFMYLKSTEDILKWIHEDDIIIKLTGEEKVDVVNTLYNTVLDGVTGTAYTMIRVGSNAIYNPVFAQLIDDPDQEDIVDDL